MVLHKLPDMERYTYKSLDPSKRQIRLLHLHPVRKRRRDRFVKKAKSVFSEIAGRPRNIVLEDDLNDPADVSCTFSLASLDDNPKFEALSYVWGDPDDLVTVHLHGCSAKVTRNLHDALIHMRQDRKRVLWADALCINQADLAERASQVRLMGSIYGQASTVIVYLGAWSNAESGFRFIEAFGTDPEEHHHDPDATSSLLRAAGLDLTPEIAKTYLREFFSLPWWSRVWTVQEFALARKAVFQSGNQLLSSISLADMLDIFLDHTSCCGRGGDSRNSWLPMEDESNLYESGVIKCAMLLKLSKPRTRQVSSPFGILAFFRNRRCSDPLDIIYGALALTDPLFQSNIELDYRSSPRRVYTGATMAYIHVSKTLDALSHVYGRMGASDIPTYVADFSVKHGHEDSHSCEYRNQYFLPHYNASRASTPKIFHQPSFEAKTQAIFIDAIQENVDDDMSEQTSFSSTGIAQHLLSRYSLPATASWQTLCAGIVGNKEPDKAYRFRPVLDSDYSTYLDWIARDEDEPSRITIEAFQFDQAVSISKEGRFYATTRTGYLGIVPNDARIGDCIVLMPGGKVPYVLRPVEDSDSTEHSGLVEGGRYEFIGDCYIHGIMNGEAWDESKLQDIILV
ncbi:hypothetical protein E8E13_010644 [Curvularia kusanoi]|uniref:Heterokaryon incompatibility domain-containing protein n=1 Tax=Curvularia kusanoi TaxID=90978 RepID=A0A9P4WA78_CURKU|nr:hypothetical protein E8E13_010644 [Curvularia kusanoi]